jgi:NAD(P)H-hydrate epimerase
MKIVTAEQMQQIDRRCAENGLPTKTLMENAGRAVAGVVKQILGSPIGQQVLMLVGPGNNGGDGLVAARYLREWGAGVTVYLGGSRPPDDPNLKLVIDLGITCIDGNAADGPDRFGETLKEATAVIDAFFGTGQSRPLTGGLVPVLEAVARAKQEHSQLWLIAVDLPSGMNADSGEVDPASLRCDATVTLGFPKFGLYSLPGAEYAGRVYIVDIGIPEQLALGIDVELITRSWCRSVLPLRPLGANKGSFGRLMIAAGSINYIGAACLAAGGALRIGTGLVTLATPRSLVPVIAARLTETTYLPLPESRAGQVLPEAARTVEAQLADYNVLLAGCGLGYDRSVVRFLGALVLKPRRPLPYLVLDADALNVLAKIDNWWQYLPDDAILTPHPGEMARLTGLSVDEVQAERIDVARRFAGQWNKTIVLKGAYTVIANPDGMVNISGTANPGLSTAGTGDVLAGVIAGLVAQSLPLFDAAALGVYLHAQAGEWVREEMGDMGMLASDLPGRLPLVVKQLKEG